MRVRHAQDLESAAAVHRPEFTYLWLVGKEGICWGYLGIMDKKMGATTLF